VAKHWSAYADLEIEERHVRRTLAQAESRMKQIDVFVRTEAGRGARPSTETRLRLADVEAETFRLRRRLERVLEARAERDREMSAAGAGA
jgi:hypothetical protein